ncbi:YSC84-related protein [Luteolibacter arcticus]|uniref:YSC84-related protein n=1 Tax=Luteolibacter arcticus TaxID=1581411 RepID=A0ABT3GLS6_9BACT|nr:YSC84-related protein [Luteolibacter arcticus]MCW1924468.1 YSC84-related protein [Luteolibacter arcticus]
MKLTLRLLLTAAGLSFACLGLTQCATGPTTANASASTISSESRAALRDLYRQNPKARSLGARAKGVLVFPNVTKGGFMLGGMGGNGALVRSDGSISDYYQTGGISYGLQAGVQKYSYALFLMDREAFDNINRADGWEVGSSPTLVIVDEGKSASLSTTTIDSGTYAFFFHQRGLMGGLGLQGSKITRIQPGR